MRPSERCKRCATTDGLAALAGVHVRTIQRIERGQTRRMHRATRQALLDTLMLDLKMRRARAEGILDPHYEMGQEAKS